MFCTNCGNEIPDGSAFCVHCGSPVGGQQMAPQQPMSGPQQMAPQQPMNGPQQMAPQQPMNGPQQMAPQQPMGGPQQMNQGMAPGQFSQGQPYGQQPYGQQQYMAPSAGGAAFNAILGGIKMDPLKAVTYIAALVIIFTTFLPGWYVFWGTGYNMFQLGGKVIFCGIFILLSGLAILCIELLDKFVPSLFMPFTNIRNLPFFQFYIPGFIFLLFFIASVGGNIANLRGLGSMGFQWYVQLLCVIALFVRPVVKIAQKQPYTY